MNKMESLEKWCLYYIDGVVGNQVCWNDGEKIAEVLAKIDPVWFSKLRLVSRYIFSVSVTNFIKRLADFHLHSVLMG